MPAPSSPPGGPAQGPITLIRQAEQVLVWDPATASHGVLRHADLALADGRIVHVGGRFEGEVERTLDGRGLLVMPGLVDTHSHPWSETLNRGFGEDMFNERLRSTMYEHKPGWGDDLPGYLASASLAYADLLRSGVTALVDVSTPYPGWVDNLARSGLRGVAAPMMRSATWSLDAAGETVHWHWSEDGGAESFSQAIAAVDEALAHPSGRLGAMVMPAQVDTCTERFLEDALDAARARGIALQIHAAQTLAEREEMKRRHRLGPIAWLEEVRLLAPEVTLSHATLLDHHSWVGAKDPGDLERMGRAGVSIAHCPTVPARSMGLMLEDLARYRASGVNVSIGTDTAPHNMLEEMRLAAYTARLAAGDVRAGTTAAVFDAATLGGARALLREDIGRIAVGCCADVVLVDLAHPLMAPGNDPLRSLVFHAAERAVRDVFVAGEQVVRDGRVLTVDEAAALVELRAANRRAIEAFPRFDRAGRRATEVGAPTLPALGDGSH